MYRNLTFPIRVLYRCTVPSIPPHKCSTLRYTVQRTCTPPDRRQSTAPKIPPSSHNTPKSLHHHIPPSNVTERRFFINPLSLQLVSDCFYSATDLLTKNHKRVCKAFLSHQCKLNVSRKRVAQIFFPSAHPCPSCPELVLPTSPRPNTVRYQRYVQYSTVQLNHPPKLSYPSV